MEEMKMEDRNQMILDGIKGLRSLADALEIAVESINTHTLESIFSPKGEQPDLFEQVNTTQEKPEEISLTLTDVRKVLAEKSRAGHTEQVRVLLEKYGADKLSAINPTHYKNLVNEATYLGATLEDIKAALEEKTKEGLKDKFPAVFGHHYATTLEDLKPSSYPSFLRDIRGLSHE